MPSVWDEAKAAERLAEQNRWVVALRSWSFTGGDVRLRVVADFMVLNELSGVSDLKKAGDPAKWAGAGMLHSCELSFLRTIGQKGFKRDRYVHTVVSRASSLHLC
jgi:hypothetical protein